MPRLILATSSLNFSYGDAARRSPQWFDEAIDTLGFDGIEWSDVPNLHPKSLAAGGLARWLAGRGKVLSLQQSWQSDRYRDIPANTKDVWRTDGIVAAGKAALLQTAIITALPRLDHSLGKLDRVQKAAGQKLPTIVHPNEQHLGDRPRGKHIDYRRIRESGVFGPLRFQVTAELLHAWDVLSSDPYETVDNMLSIMDDVGEFDGVVYDSHHAVMERGGHTLPQPAAMAGELARRRRLDELQLCWRPDFGGGANELKMALDGRFHKTPQGQALAAVSANLPEDQSLCAVIEAPSTAFRQAGYDDYIGAQRDLVTVVREAVPHLQ